LIVFSVAGVAGCAGSGPNANIASVGSERITVKDFEDAYAKNNGGWEKGAASTFEERERFLDLLVRFRLKVQEARAQGLVQDSSIRSELKTYGLSIATSYMLDKELVDPNLRKMFERKTEEVRASHILVRLDAAAQPQDTVAAYERAMKIIKEVPNKPFDTLAVAYSEDPSVSVNKGDLGFFAGGKMVLEFEDAAYKLPVGKFTNIPIRTNFGYHIIKVTGRRAAPGPVSISHILRRFSQNLQDTTSVRDSVWQIYNRIKAGLDFGNAAQQYSQDPASAAQGGFLGYFEHSRLPENLVSMFYQLPPGGVTEPIRFPYGYHLFKLVDRRALPSYDDMEKDLRSQYQQTRYTTDYQNYVHGLKKKFNLSYDVSLLFEFTHAFDSTKTPAAKGWGDTVAAAMRSRTLFTCNGKSVPVREVVDLIADGQEFRNTLLTVANVETIVERMTELKVLEEESTDIPQRHPAFGRLMKEYEDGILLFRIEQDEVWNKVSPTDSALHAYYEQTKEQYRWPNRISVQEILCASDSIAKAAYRKLRSGKEFGGVAGEYTLRTNLKEKGGTWGLLPSESRDFLQQGWTMAVDSVSEPFQGKEGWEIVKVLQKDGARTKTYQEVLPELSSAYREYASKVREKTWVDELKSKFGVAIRKELLGETFKKK
jgi:peptidyl-prolyl cis-trans isomerase SurA